MALVSQFMLRDSFTAILLALLMLVVLPAPAQDAAATAVLEPFLVGRVLKISDGDTLRVQLSSGPVIVRLDSIDAPEHDQAQGAEARQALTKLVPIGAEIAIRVVTQDSYERLVAVVFARDTDMSELANSVNAQLVKAGFAWAYRHFLKDTNYCRWEQDARAAKRGLWAQASREWILPYQFRRMRRQELTQPEDFSRETAQTCIASVSRR
jgi:micrococcal nuclease